MSLEQGLFKSFDDIVRRQLDAVWHTVSLKTKQVRQDPAQAPLDAMAAVRWSSYHAEVDQTIEQACWHDVSANTSLGALPPLSLHLH